jgi:hypothetical protein
MYIFELLSIALAGLLSTLALSLFLTLIRQLRFSNVSLVQIIGSFFTQAPKGLSLGFGWFLHLVFGTFFAYIYTLVLKTIPGIGKYTFSYLLAGSALGFIHGVVFALLLLILVVEHHPIQKYREVGFGGAVYYFLAHIIYGLTFGFLYMFFVSWGYIL